MLNYLVSPLAFNVADETHLGLVVLVGRVVETLLSK